MAASYDVELDEGGSVKDLFDDPDVKQNFDCKGSDDKGELVLKDDKSVVIAYTVKDDTVSFKVTKSPKMFSDSAQKDILTTLFG